MANNEDYLNSLIAKAKKSWEGVDVESYMSDLRDDTDKEDAVLPKEIASYIAEQAKYNRLKIIEERAEQYATRPLIPDSTIPAHIANERRNAYIAGVKDQQYIDKLLIEQLIDKAWRYFEDMLDSWCLKVGLDPEEYIPAEKERFYKMMEE